MRKRGVGWDKGTGKFTSDVFVYSSLSDKKILRWQNGKRTKPFACSCRSENRIFVLGGLAAFSLELSIRRSNFISDIFAHSSLNEQKISYFKACPRNRIIPRIRFSINYCPPLSCYSGVLL